MLSTARMNSSGSLLISISAVDHSMQRITRMRFCDVVR
jgi:hypothetical protein